MWLRVRDKCFLSVLRLWFFVLWTLCIWHYIPKTYLSCKTQKSPSKVEKCQNILHLIELENVKKCIGVTFSRRKCFLCVLRHCCFVLQTLWISYYIPKNYLGNKHCFKKLLEALKLKSHLQKSKNVIIFWSYFTLCPDFWRWLLSFKDSKSFLSNVYPLNSFLECNATSRESVEQKSKAVGHIEDICASKM